MNRNREKKEKLREIVMTGVGTFLFVFLLFIVIYSLRFLSNKVLPVLSHDSSGGVEELHFDLEGFEELNL